jgi:hypothetical protein
VAADDAKELRELRKGEPAPAQDRGRPGKPLQGIRQAVGALSRVNLLGDARSGAELRRRVG